MSAYPECEWRDCAELADYRFVATWSRFDFDEQYYACLVHAPQLISYLQRRIVGGFELQELIPSIRFEHLEGGVILGEAGSTPNEPPEGP